MNENELIPADVDLPVGKYAGEDVFKDIATSTAWLPRIQLCGGNSALCQQGKISIGHYALIKSKDEHVSLTNVFDLVPVGWRPKAIFMETGKNPVSYFDSNSTDFQKIKEKSAEQNSGCMYGPEFLVWIPGKDTFATYFMANKTARNVASELLSILKARGGATLKSRLIETKQYKWHGPLIVKCSAPLDVPSMEDITLELDKFNNPPASAEEVEAAEPVGADARPQ